MNAANGKTSVLIIDDDEVTLSLLEAVLNEAGFDVQTMTDSENALKAIEKSRPDVVLSDLMMPKIDGFELCQSVRENEALKDTRFIVVSAKAYASDEARALELGADGFIRKPINTETFADKLRSIIEDQISMTFWGVRGTLPKTGSGALKYGGNTSCVTLEFPNQQLFIFDGGSGIKELGSKLLQEKKKRINAKLFISHPHWDHINAIPFFAPLYMQGNEFEILGAKQGDITMRELISAQMDGVYFPITLTEFSARTYFRNLEEGTHDVAGIEVQTKLLAHPGRALGYRVNYNGRSICYVTDQELYLDDSDFFDPHYEKTINEFIRGADVLITDTTYTDEEYKTKVNWGHSCVSKVCEMAHKAEVKELYLFHHDPDQDDDKIDAKFEAAKAKLKELGSKVICFAPKEGDNVRL
ncbi:response regulator [Thalassospiraceae bacterium LMO-JJ14]|nr:response regulator [Thalassospiraceae bacterium LMO-JJ14]